jgi:hypothetical protein
MFASRYLPCTECGASVERAAADGHRCSPERLAEYRMFALREEIATFEDRLAAWLGTNRGRFDVWLAARQVRAS